MVELETIGMTLGSIRSISQILAAGVLGSALCLAEAPADSTAYIAGTIQEIPTRTNGTLDLGDPDNLHFRYGDTDYSIPYERVMGYAWDKAGKETVGGYFAESADTIGRALLPMFFDKSKFLTIKFSGADSAEPQRVVFEVPTSIKKSADPVLKSWVARNNKLPTAKLSETWWGDRYWKTKNNRSQWESAQGN